MLSGEKFNQGRKTFWSTASHPITLREARRIGLNVEPLSASLNRKLLELNALYSKMGQRARASVSHRLNPNCQAKFRLLQFYPIR